MDIGDIIQLEEWSDENQYKPRKKPAHETVEKEQLTEYGKNQWVLNDRESFNLKYRQDLAESQIEPVSTIQNSFRSVAKNDEDQESAPIFKKKHLSRAIGPDGIVDMQEYLEKQHHE